MDLKHLVAHQRRRGSGPVLDLQFATDKTLTARVGPTPTFTRASSATFVNSSGLIQYAPENLIRYSHGFSNALWLTGSGATKIGASTIADPDGGANAYRINVGSAITGGSAVYQILTSNVQQSQFTLSLWVRSESNTSIFALQIWNGSARVPSPNFTATTTWTRFTFTTSSTLITQFQIVSGSAGGVVGDILVYGAQLEHSSYAGVYIPTTSSAIYGPRFDHDPSTLVCKGLLMEDTRTNLISRSQEFENVSTWNQTGITVSSNIITAPDGTSTADALIESALLENHSINTAFNVATGTTYTWSVFLKSNGRPFVNVRTNVSSSEFDLSAGTISVVGTGVPEIKNFGDGWYRCSIQFVSNGTNVAPSVLMKDSIGGSVNYTGNGTSGIYLWGAQVEAGTNASSYIPTTTGSLARSADVCSITGTGATNAWNSLQGSVYASGSSFGKNALFYPFVTASSGTASTSLSLSNYSTTSAITQKNTPEQYKATSSHSAFGYRKIIYGYTNNDTSISYANNLLQTATTNNATPSVALTSFLIGPSLNGWVSSIQYYRKRISNSSLQALSAIVTNTITYNGVQIQYNSDTNGLQTTN